MTRLFFLVFLALTTLLRPAFAQQTAWVQVEAQPSLAAAEARARVYATSIADVNGFSLGGGWYAVALGPYTQPDAEALLIQLRNQRRIPRDSFIAFTGSFRDQFWPIGANLLNVAPREAPVQTDVQNDTQIAQAQTETAVQPEPEPEPSDETPREARASENRLSRDEKKELQIMLQWAGFYNAAIDGAFGRGTRNSLRAWQEANNYEPTGVLTTLQRAALKEQYNAVLAGLDLNIMEDTASGIEIAVPLGVVAFDRHESPFAHFEPTGSVPDARVLLISQQGDQNTLFGLYEIMQTLEIVPQSGERRRDRNSFTLVGQNDRIISYTEARLDQGQVKGFTLVWPTGDEERRTRLLDEMRKSFARIDGVLDPTAGMDELQSIDLVSGLRIRTPKISRSGFFVNGSGATLTALEAVQSCGRITLDGDYDATIMAVDEAVGVAILQPTETLAPANVARLRAGNARLKSEVAVAGYPFEGALSAPTLTFGTFADVKGLGGETTIHRLDMTAMPGDVGGPVLDRTGATIGMLAPADVTGRTLPAGVGFSVPSDVIADLLGQAGVTASMATSTTALASEDLAAIAADMTVLVSCWE
ncbi:MAG: trypsin-like peptidase domain-containing protein [Pseudomonadota bacterium]